MPPMEEHIFAIDSNPFPLGSFPSVCPGFPKRQIDAAKRAR